MDAPYLEIFLRKKGLLPESESEMKVKVRFDRLCKEV